jgi:hypothetical protein
MTIEFTRNGKTYVCALATVLPPPVTIQIPFRPCVLKPPHMLVLDFVATDELRGIALYKPVREVYP